MAKKCNIVNWNRIISIAGLTLCTTLIATGFNTIPSIVNALLIAGVATFTELKIESDTGQALQNLFNKGLVI